MGRYTSQVVLITGASAGIGQALALEYARQGATVVATARRIDRLQDMVAGIEAAAGRAMAVACDVTSDGDLESAAAAVAERYGRLDVVVANAGFGVGGALERLELADYRRQLETNLFGVLRTVMATREMLEASQGRLAIVGSVVSWVALPQQSAYAISKFAVRALATSLGYELAPRGVSVTLVAPGYVESEIRKVDNQGRLRPEWDDRVPRWLVLPADRAARQMVRAIHRRRRQVVITGHGKLAVGLERLAPGLLAQAIRRFGGR
jgi:NAD(P)-dependent dehydrogenase (short-subunit alcohol dehydrogenase family)